jgi:DNA excision repair protein ERCC-2
MKETNSEKLQNEYRRLVEGLQEALEAQERESFLANPGYIVD